MKTIFMGTPDFAAVILKALTESRHQVAYAVTQTDKARNRGKKIQYTPVKELAVSEGIEVLQPEKVRGNEEFLDIIRECAPDVIVVAAYGQILPKELLEMPKYGCINVHASLLPKLRGAAPIQKAIIDGEKETGVTIMQMAEGLDTGDMLLKESVEIGRMNYSRLHDRLAEVGARLLIEALDLIEEGKVQAEKQNESLSTYAHMISKADGKVDFSRSPEEIERLIRGFDPWPGAFCDCGDVVMKLWQAEPLEEDIRGIQPGTVLSADAEGLKIACGGRALLVTEIQVPGKKRVSVGDYLKGNRIEAGTVLK